MRRYILCDAGAGGDIGAVAESERSDERGVGADEDVIADGGGVFVYAIVVAGDGAGADVRARADDGVAEVGEVVGLGTAAHANLLGLDEVADVSLRSDVTAGAQVRVSAEESTVADDGLVEDAAVPYEYYVTKR